MRGSSFFEGVRQIDMEMGGEPARLPIFYYDCSVMTAVFPARYGELQRLMPDPRFVPARLGPGLGSLIVSALEYRDCDIHPYNELMIAVLLTAPGRTNFPGRALIDSLLQTKQNHAFILHLPVTTPIALAGGVDFYNFPKFLAAIDFAENDGTRSCRLAEGQEHILTLTGATPHAVRTTLFSHLYMDGQPQLAELKMNETQKGICHRPGAAQLALGQRHPVALELDRLLVSRRSVHYERTPRMEA
ncbi:MAG: acetoacetate decarboxylase family protein, partial [Thermoleophilia bacterium]